MALRGSMLDERPASYGTQQAPYDQYEDMRRMIERLQYSNNPRDRATAAALIKQQSGEIAHGQERAEDRALREREITGTEGYRQTQAENTRAYRESQMGEREADRTAKENAAILALAQSPQLGIAYGAKAVPTITKNLMNEYLRRNHLDPVSIAGAPENDPTKQALINYVKAGQQKTGGGGVATATGAATKPADVGLPTGPTEGTGRNITGKVYGTTATPTAGTPQAWEIAQLYGGKPSIPATGPAGYYSTEGKFMGPAYTPEGGLIPMPQGATGLRGRAGATGDVAQRELPTNAAPAAPSVAGGAPGGAGTPRSWLSRMLYPWAGGGPSAPVAGASQTAQAPATPVAPAAKPPGPPVNIDVDKWLWSHIGQPTMESLRPPVRPPTPYAPEVAGTSREQMSFPEIQSQAPKVGASELAAPPSNILPAFSDEQQAALEAARRAAEEEARRRAALAAAGHAGNPPQEAY